MRIRMDSDTTSKLRYNSLLPFQRMNNLHTSSLVFKMSWIFNCSSSLGSNLHPIPTATLQIDSTEVDLFCPEQPLCRSPIISLHPCFLYPIFLSLQAQRLAWMFQRCGGIHSD